MGDFKKRSSEGYFFNLIFLEYSSNWNYIYRIKKNTSYIVYFTLKKFLFVRFIDISTKNIYMLTIDYSITNFLELHIFIYRAIRSSS